MKYGYMFYQKMIRNNIRKANIGDPIQSIAVKNLYREMGIPEEDIIPVPRYDMAEYDGEECVCIVNCCSSYEDWEGLYDSKFMPPSPGIHAIPMSLHIHRNIPEDELKFYKKCGGVGCRDISTVNYLQSLGVEAYLSGCLTLTLPRRSDETAGKADKVYFVDVSSDVTEIMPRELREEGIELSNIATFTNLDNSNRFSVENTYELHRMAEERVVLLRDTARLVVTSRLHIACPCAAMGIPVILAKNHFGERFGFIDRIIPTYTPEHYEEINWNPSPAEFEEEKAKIKRMFFDRVRAEASRIEVSKMWDSKRPIYDIDYSTAASIAVKKIPFAKGSFNYAVWGVASEVGMYLDEAMKNQVPDSRLICGIDIAVEGKYNGVNIIKPEQIAELPKDTVIIVAALSAQKYAKDFLMNTGRPFVLLKDTEAESYNVTSCNKL